MANKIRISFDTGAGWVVYSALDNNLVWGNYNDINPAIFRIRLTGNVTFIGSEYTAILAFKDAGNNYIPILVEQDDSGWNTIFEGNADLLMPWNENVKSITLNKFNNEDDIYDNLISNYTIKYGLNTFGLTDHTLTIPTTQTTTVDAVKQPNALTPVQYVAAFDINGNPSSVGFPDTRWAYFTFRSTDGDGSHNFETMAYPFDPDTSLGYNKILLFYNGQTVNFWVKTPPGIGASETFLWAVVKNFNRFPDVMGALLTIAVSTLTFTEGTAVTYAGLFDDDFGQFAWFDYSLYQIGEAAAVSQQGFKGSEISLKACFDIMEAFGLYWYLDGSALKFKHQSELSTTGSLDLSTLTAELQRLEYIEADNIPDIETWTANDSEGIAYDSGGGTGIWGEMQIYYRNANSELTNTRKKEYKIPISTNVPALMAGLANTDKNNFALVETEDNTTVPRSIYTPTLTADFNNRLSAIGFFNNQVKWRYGTDANLATRLKLALLSLGNFATRPLLKIPITDYHINLLTDYDMDKAVVTSAGTGRTKEITQRLDSDTSQLLIEL